MNVFESPERAPRRRRTRLGLAGLVAVAASALAACGAGPAAVTTPTSATTPVQSSAQGAASSASSSTSASQPATPATSSTDSPVIGSCPPTPKAMITKAPGDGKTVALTFDDGPAEADRTIVELLDRYDVHATFFLTGKNAEALPEVAKLIADHGNLVANHSWEHRYPSEVSGGWTQSYVAREMSTTKDELESITGTVVCYYRPPGGYPNNVLAAASKVGLTPVMWSVDTEDWQQPSNTTPAATASIVSKATKVGGQTHPIVLMHSTKASHEPDSKVSPNRSNTLAALPEIIEWYQAHGFTFVRLDGER